MAVGRISDTLGTRNFRDGKIIFTDGAGVPNQLEILGAEGDLSFTETDGAFIIMSRGKIVGRGQGDEEALTLNFTIKFEQWAYETGADQGVSPVDAMKQRNGASTWVSTASCGPYSIDTEYHITNACGGAGVEKLTFTRVHFASVTFNEGNEFNTLAATGTSLDASPGRVWVA